MEKYNYVIVGAGFAGTVLAERLATQVNKKILIIDKRNHLGGNCYDYLSDEGILIQKYGPHIFHTISKKVFDYLSQFTEWNNYKHKVFAFFGGKFYSIPINLDTVNKFYNLNLRNEKELKEFLETKKIEIKEIKNSRDVVVSKFGMELYEAFVKNYTKKQWDKFPEELDKSVLERLPLKYNQNPYYFNDEYQGMPKLGFTKIFEKMLDNKNIKILLNTDFFKTKKNFKFGKLIFTGRIDQFFNYKFGKLDYRGINFVFENLNQENFQPNSVINYPSKDVKFSRITEFKKFYDKKSNNTIICKDFFVWDGEPSYPVINKKNLEILEKYEKEAEKLKNIIFVGRLAQYKYLNMDRVIENALDVFESISKIK